MAVEAEPDLAVHSLLARTTSVLETKERHFKCVCSSAGLEPLPSKQKVGSSTLSRRARHFLGLYLNWIENLATNQKVGCSSHPRPSKKSIFA